MGLDMILVNSDCEKIAYWRKANMIHAWFERRICSNNPEFTHFVNSWDYEVSYEDLVCLLDDIKKVLVNNTIAGEVLPTCSGFFFGSLLYDEYYFDILSNSQKMLEEILKEYCEGDTFFYSATW